MEHPDDRDHDRAPARARDPAMPPFPQRLRNRVESVSTAPPFPQRPVYIKPRSRKPGRIATVNIIGISAFFHESACCLIQDGRLIAAAEEERFSRIKHDPGLPLAAFEYYLRAGGIGVDEVDSVA